MSKREPFKISLGDAEEFLELTYSKGKVYKNFTFVEEVDSGSDRWHKYIDYIFWYEEDSSDKNGYYTLEYTSGLTEYQDVPRDKQFPQRVGDFVYLTPVQQKKKVSFYYVRD